MNLDHCSMGEGAAYDGPTKESNLTKFKFVLVGAMVSVTSLIVAGTAGAVITQPTIPVSAYGDSLLSGVGDAITAIFPYAAAVTAFAIGVGVVKRWLGHRKATSI